MLTRVEVRLLSPVSCDFHSATTIVLTLSRSVLVPGEPGWCHDVTDSLTLPLSGRVLCLCVLVSLMLLMCDARALTAHWPPALETLNLAATLSRTRHQLPGPSPAQWPILSPCHNKYTNVVKSQWICTFMKYISNVELWWETPPGPAIGVPGHLQLLVSGPRCPGPDWSAERHNRLGVRVIRVTGVHRGDAIMSPDSNNPARENLGKFGWPLLSE